VTDALLRRVRPDQVREITLVLVILGMLAFFATQIPNYLTDRTFNRITTGLPIVAVVACGQVLVVLTRNIDLSVGSVVGLVAYSIGSLMGTTPDLNPAIVILIAMGMGAVMGMVNGAIVAYGRVPAIITTLGTLALYRVILVESGGGRTVTTTGFPDWLVDFPATNLVTMGGLDIRIVFGITLLVVLLGQLALRYLPYGRRLYAIGSNPDAARTAGLPVQRDVFWAFTACGALAGLGGFLFLSRFGNITVVAGAGLELQAVAAVVVGGVNIFGGSGSMVGAFLGATLIEILQQSLNRWIGISDFVRDAILGLLILLAVAADAIILGRLQDAWVRVRRRDEERTRSTLEAGSGA
jgi:rhamnose transport system permease protein